jgi:hypothetical protein
LQAADTEDLERLTEIALAAKESGAGNAEVAEQIRTSIPRFRPLADWLLSSQGVGVATWLMLFITIWVALRPSPSAPASQPAPPSPPAPGPTLVINCPDGRQREVEDLIDQIAREFRGNRHFEIIIDREPTREHRANRDQHGPEHG